MADLQREAQDRDQRILELEGSLARLTGDDVGPVGNGSDASAPGDGFPELAPALEGSGGPGRDAVGDQEAPNVKAHVNIRVEQEGEFTPMANDAGNCGEAAVSGEPVVGAHDPPRDPDVGDGGGHDPGLESDAPAQGAERQRQPDVPGDALAGGEFQLDLFAPRDWEPQPESVSAGDASGAQDPAQPAEGAG